jgi:flagellar export protein FliJ
MPPFRFRLATLLRLREANRDEKRLLLADAQRAEQIVTDRIVDIDRQLAGIRGASADASQPGPVNVDTLMEMQRYELLLKAERSTAEQQRQVVAAEVLRRRETLLAADREVRVLEKLREGQQQRHRQEEDRLDHKRLDEIALRGYWRKEK